MQDPRALANTNNLNSYRAWERESLGRSGLNTVFLLVVLSTPIFTSAALMIEHATRGDPGALARLMSAALILYVLAVGGLMLFGVRRQKAWKRAHPWTPPAPRAPRGDGRLLVG